MRGSEGVLRRGEDLYALTTQRVIIASGNSVTSLALASLDEIELVEAGDGIGSLTLGPKVMGRRGTVSRHPSGRPTTPTFERIPEAKRVLAAIREAQTNVQRQSNTALRPPASHTEMKPSRC